MAWYQWSQTAASNATADPAVNFQEGQAPSSVNDSARALMASTAKWRDDVAGAILTGGTSTSYTVTSFSVFDTLAHLGGQMVAFTPHATNGATVTLNVDGLGAKPLRSAPSTELLAGTLILGTPYVAVYNNSDSAFYLQNFYGNPYNVPLGCGLDYWFSVAPNSAFVIPIGQAISRTTYSAFFGTIGTTYGVGDGSTTFNLPDKRGRVSAMVDSSAGRLSTATVSAVTVGGVGGTETHALTTAEMPVHSHANSLTDPGQNHLYGTVPSQNVTAGGTNLGLVNGGANGSFATNTGSTGITITNANAGSGNAHALLQPTILCNYILRVL